MKLLLILFYFIICTGGRLNAAHAKNVPNVLSTLARVEHQKDAADAISLLEDIQAMDDWSMGGGQGPTDKYSLSILVLRAARPFLPWDKSGATNIQSASQSQIGDWLRADGKSETLMIEMLSSENPVARWIALEKIRTLNIYTSAVISKLEQIARYDGYFGIGRRYKDRTNSTSEPDTERVFLAPLRAIATEMLMTVGKEIAPIDESEFIQEGLRWLGITYLEKGDDPITRFSIASALRQLDPRSDAIKNAQESASVHKSDEQITETFKRLTERYGQVHGSKNAAQARGTDGGSPVGRKLNDAEENVRDRKGYSEILYYESTKYAGIIILVVFIFTVFYLLFRRRG